MIITVANEKGGVGKTTIAFNLAVMFSRANNIKVIDLDNQKALTFVNAIRENNNKPPLDIIKIKNEQELKDVIVRGSQDIYIIDCGGFDSGLNRLSVIGADLVLTPISDRTLDLIGFEKYKKTILQLNKIKNSDIKNYVILNNIPHQTKNLDELKEHLSSSYFKVLKSRLSQRKDFAKSFSDGLSINEYDKKSKASVEFKALFNELNYIVKGLLDEQKR